MSSSSEELLKDEQLIKLIERLLPPIFYGEEVILTNFYPPFKQITFSGWINQPKIKLINKDLWKEFYKFGTEMILTNIGRRIFPPLAIKISNIEPNQKYLLVVDFIPYNEYTYKFNYGYWTYLDKISFSDEIFGLCKGKRCHTIFMQSSNNNKILTIDKIKITNNAKQKSAILLRSLYRYMPRITIIKLGDTYVSSYIFPGTQFYTVTAYQNEKISKLKIKYNPFAKGNKKQQKF